MSIVAVALALLSANNPLPGAMAFDLPAAGPVAVAATGSTAGGQVPLKPCTSTNRTGYWGYALAAAVVDAVPNLANGAIVGGFTGVTRGNPVYVADDGTLTHTAPASSGTINVPVESVLGTLSATGTTTIIVPVGVTTLSQLSIGVKTTVATDDTNYWTMTATNKSNGNAVMLAATDANTNKATGGSAITAYTTRNLTLTGTTANLNVTAGDEIEIAFTKTASGVNLVQLQVEAMFQGAQVGQVPPIGIGTSTTSIYFFVR